MHSLPPVDPPNVITRAVVTWDDTVTLFCDPDADNFHIDVNPNRQRDTLIVALEQARDWGLEMMDPDDECRSELLTDDTVRIWLTPTVSTGGGHVCARFRRPAFNRNKRRWNACNPGDPSHRCDELTVGPWGRPAR